MQAFRAASLSERIARDEGSKAYLGRKHFMVSRTGFATAAQAAMQHRIKEEPTVEDSIFNKLSLKAVEDLNHA